MEYSTLADILNDGWQVRFSQYADNHQWLAYRKGEFFESSKPLATGEEALEDIVSFFNNTQS